MPRALAFVAALALMSSCATYEGSRNTAAVSGVTFAAGLTMWMTAGQTEHETLAYTGIAVGTASMMAVMASAIGMAVLPKRVEVALRIAHELVVRAASGDCATVADRRREVEDLDSLVYEVVLMDDPAVAECFGLSSSSLPSSPSSVPAAPARPDPGSTSIVR